MTLNIDRSNWSRVKFGDVARKVMKKVDPEDGTVTRYVAGEHMDTDELRIIRWGTVGDGYLGPAFNVGFQPGQVLYGSRRTYLRKVALADFDGVCANTTFVIESSDASVLLPSFLPLVMRTEEFHAHSISESKGSVNPYINWPDIAKFEFMLPPLEQQKRIAELVWGIERHRRATMAFGEALNDALVALVSGWWSSTELVPLKEVGRSVTGSTPSTAETTYWNSEDVCFATPGDFDRSCIESTSRWVSKSGSLAGRLIPANSVAIVCIGATLGKCAVLVPGGLTNQQITCVVDLDESDSYVLQTLLSHPRGQQALWARSGATTMPQLNKSNFEQVKVPWGTKELRTSWAGNIDLISRGLSAVSQELCEVSRLLASSVGYCLEGTK
jgi:type I restriction enzyme S subunit